MTKNVDLRKGGPIYFMKFPFYFVAACLYLRVLRKAKKNIFLACNA